MQNKTNTRIQIPSHPIPGETQRTATVTGPKEGCDEVKLMIQAIVAAQSSAPVMNGTYNQPQQAGGYYGQPAPQDQYSAEWAAYHAAQAAVQQQQQQQSVAATAPAPAAAATTPDTYYEQFFRYAYYYGEEAARNHYGAWSPPVGTPNPYGVNPNGVTPAPAPIGAPVAAAPVAAPVPAPAPSIQQFDRVPEARETGRRKVSNLPAWMKKS